ncbi:MAG: histidine kinase, partial [Rhizobium sp.]
PHWLRERLGLGKVWSLTPLERLIVKALARTSEKIVLLSSPAVQSCRRLGLPDDFLYRRAL